MTMGLVVVMSSGRLLGLTFEIFGLGLVLVLAFGYE